MSVQQQPSRVLARSHPASKRDVLARLHELSLRSIGGATLETILGKVVDIAIELSGADFGDVQLLDPLTSDFKIVAQRGFPSWWIDFWNEAAKTQGSCGVAVACGERVIVEDVRTHPVFIGKIGLEMQLRAGVLACQSTPLFGRTGRQVGVFSTHYREPHRPGRRILQVLDLLARQAAEVIEAAQAAQALQESEQRFRALVTTGAYAVYRMGPDWTGLRFLEDNGFPPAPLVSTATWLDCCVHPDDRPPLREQIRNTIRTKSIFEVEHRVRRSDGTTGWTHSRVVPVLNNEGELIEWFGAASDITPRKNSERKIFEQNQLLEALMRALPIGVAFTGDPASAHVTGNATLLAQFDAGSEDNVSASAPEIDAHGRKIRYFRNGQQVCDTALPLQRAAREGQVVPPEEFEVRMPSGRRWDMETSAAPLRNEQGEVTGSVAVVVDVTARKQAALDREHARIKDEFLTILGHELRNPLAALSNAIHLLPNAADATRRKSLEQLITRQTTVLRRLVDDLLDVSRITRGQILLRKEDLDLTDLLHSAAEPARLLAAEREQQLIVRTSGERVVFRSDPVRIRQIIVNLLDNASKYAGKGGRIELSASAEVDDVVIRCSDNGCGIPLELQERIFEPLIRSGNTGDNSAGLGLGLTLVKRLAELHGGTVSVRSAGLGCGSEFVVRLPWSKPALTPAVPTVTAPPSRGRALSFVLVEDNCDVGEMFTLALRHAGHNVTHFPDGPSALGGIEALTPDTIILDIGLPGMDGYTVLSEMKKQSRLRDTCFIALSGFPQSSGNRKDEAAFDYYLVKPVHVEEIVSLAGRWRTPARESTPLRVLLVEDHADLANAMAELLQSEGLEVLTTYTGEAALQAASGFQPRLILCDMNLPDVKGLDLVRILRTNPVTRTSHVTMISARSESAIRIYNAKAAEMGVDEFVSKPITPEIIRTIVANLRS